MKPTCNHLQSRRVGTSAALASLIVSVTCATTCGAASASTAPTAAPAHHSARPAPGTWKYAFGNEGERGGSLSVNTRGTRITKLVVEPGSGCGGDVAVSSAMIIRPGGPRGDNGKTAYHVGASSAVSEPVDVSQDGTTQSADLYVNFDQVGQTGNVSVSLTLSDACEFNISFSKRVGHAPAR